MVFALEFYRTVEYKGLLCQDWLVAPYCEERSADLAQEGEVVIVFTNDMRREIEGRVIHAPASSANLEAALLEQLLQFTNSPEMGVSPP